MIIKIKIRRFIARYFRPIIKFIYKIKIANTSFKHDPIIIIYPGKVGSSSIYMTLKKKTDKKKEEVIAEVVMKGSKTIDPSEISSETDENVIASLWHVDDAATAVFAPFPPRLSCTPLAATVSPAPGARHVRGAVQPVQRRHGHQGHRAPSLLVVHRLLRHPPRAGRGLPDHLPLLGRAGREGRG